MKRPSRKERRKAKALTRKTKPLALARLGVPIFTGTAVIVLDAPDGPQTKYYWWASEDLDPSSEQIMENLHGPFDTEAEAKEAARIAVIGPDCKLTEGGTWDPAWNKPQ